MKTKSLSTSFFFLLPLSLILIMLAVHPRKTEANVVNGGMTPPIHWASTFVDATSLYDAVKTSDGRFVVAGDYGSGPNSFNGFLAKLDLDGTILWQKAYVDSENDTSKINAIAELSDNSLVAVGEYFIYSGDTSAYISKFTADGDLVWQLEMGGYFSQKAYDVIPLDDGQFLLAGTDLGEISDGWLARIDADGTVLWQKRYGNDKVNRFSSGVRTSDGNIVLAGTTWKTSSYQSGDGWLMKVNLNGDILWQKSFDNYWSDFFTDIVEMENGDLVASGGTNSAFATQYAWAVKFDPNGNLIWQREWPDPDHVIGLYSVVDAENGWLIFAGTHYNESPVGWLIALNEETGVPVWEKVYGSTADSDRFSKIISAGDSDLFVVGETESYSANRRGWALKVAENGYIAGCDVITTPVYPSNPTTATTTSTTFTSQATTYTPTNEASNIQTFTNPLDNQCYLDITFTDFSYLPAEYKPPQ
ncbi:MAG: PQQ-binding-like beta-propeller repeat protein [Candidatus Promineifilaceae bacterium]